MTAIIIFFFLEDCYTKRTLVCRNISTWHCIMIIDGFSKKCSGSLVFFFFFKVRIPILTVPNNSPLLYWALPHWKLNANSNQTKQVGKQYSLREEDKNDCWCFRNQGLSCFQITRKTKINVFKQLPKTSSEVDYLHYEI